MNSGEGNVPTPDAGPSGLAPVSAGYRLGRILGQGGMGVVYEAHNVWTGRKVAIKFLSAGDGSNTPRATMSAERVERFVREARVATSLGHPNVVDVLDMGRWTDDGALFIAYEFLDGGTLRELLERERRLPASECYRWLIPAMNALVAAHDAGVIHRDFKPENVMLTRGTDGGAVPKVIDFGIAKGRDEGDVSVTRTGTALGTARYMAPEQARDARSVDARCDVWAAGVVWFEALAGIAPYPEENYNQLVAALLTQDPPRLHAVASDVRPSLAAVIDRALARDPDARWPSMQAFLDALHACESGSDTPASAPREADARSAVISATALADATIATAGRAFAVSRTPALADESPRVGRWWLASIVAVLAVAGLLMAQSFIGRWHSERAEETAARNSVRASDDAVAAPLTVLPTANVVGGPSPAQIEGAVAAEPARLASRPMPDDSVAQIAPRSERAAGRRRSSHRVTPPRASHESETAVGVGPVNGAPVLEP